MGWGGVDGRGVGDTGLGSVPTNKHKYEEGAGGGRSCCGTRSASSFSHKCWDLRPAVCPALQSPHHPQPPRERALTCNAHPPYPEHAYHTSAPHPQHRCTPPAPARPPAAAARWCCPPSTERTPGTQPPRRGTPPSCTLSRSQSRTRSPGSAPRPRPPAGWSRCLPGRRAGDMVRGGRWWSGGGGGRGGEERGTAATKRPPPTHPSTHPARMNLAEGTHARARVHGAGHRGHETCCRGDE